MAIKLLVLAGLLAAGQMGAIHARADTLPECAEVTLDDLPEPGISFAVMQRIAAKPTVWEQTHPTVEAEFPPPVVKHPYGTLPEHGFEIRLVVSADGVPICALATSTYYGAPVIMDEPRRALMAEVPGWRFKPFLVDGRPSRIAVRMMINEDELPEAHVDRPKGDVAEVTITQDERPWMATFGAYHVELHGDGTAIYTSGDADDLLGPQTYHVDPKAVQGVVAKAETADFWSLRDAYREPGSDGFSFERINITLGGVTKSLTDDGPSPTGMSAEAAHLQFDVLDAANIEFWQTPTQATLDQLKTNGFDFSSKAAGKLLLRMVQKPSVKDDAIVALMQLGAPQDERGYNGYVDESQDLLEAALSTGRSTLASQLIDKDALLTKGKLDDDKVSWAFSDAVYSGNLKSVELMLAFHPRLTYPDPDGDDNISVLLRLGEDFRKSPPIAVAQRLLELGANVNSANSNGVTLLHKVADNIEFANFLLDHGANINIADKKGRTPLAYVFEEDAALLLLSRGANPRNEEAGRSLRFNIKNNHWMQVKAWLADHGYADVLQAQPGDDD